jgi:hypothetical protein
MPQWGMGKGLQNVVNQWVNVNNNHVVFPEDGEGDIQGSMAGHLSMDPQAVFNSQQHRSFIANAQSRTHNVPARETSTLMTETSFSYGARANPINGRQSVQRTKGKLKKTNSQSDLLLERAAIRRNGGDPRVDMMKNKRPNIDAISISSDRSSQKLPGQYVNENAFANQHRSKQLAAKKSEHSSKSRQRRDGAKSMFGPSDRSEASQGSYLSSIPDSMKLNAPLGTLPSVSSGHSVSEAKSKTPSAPSKSVADNCDKCEDTTNRLLALEAELEYLRSAALNSEYVCMSCERRNNNLSMNSASSVTSGRSVKSNRSRHSKSSSRIDSSAHSIGNRSRKSRQIEPSLFNENIALAESSQRLIDATSRHKRHMEHMSKELARVKNDRHLQLSKLAMMCKDLNDESAKRKEFVDVAKEDLSGMREERDAISSELDILKARVALYEKQEAENAKIRRLLLENENETLSIADKAIAERDAIIEDLTARLAKSMDMLDAERAQNQQQKP